MAVVRAPWPVPRIDTVGELAERLELDTVGELAERLELDTGQLAWLADVRGLEATAGPKLRNYTYVRLPRTHGPPRVIERLHRAAHDGPGDLDPAHVMGRIAWAESLNPARGAKLRARFAAVRW
ncbi:MAG TPA: hypothetical protein VFZ00_01775 [Solirubrobacter sp.]|nr:hypothetical protein [Solirubrobacter sp.]